MRSSDRAAAVVELFVRAVFAELRAQRMDAAYDAHHSDGSCDDHGSMASRSEPTVNVWRGQLGGAVN
jgi:hypothetical protein